MTRAPWPGEAGQRFRKWNSPQTPSFAKEPARPFLPITRNLFAGPKIVVQPTQRASRPRPKLGGPPRPPAPRHHRTPSSGGVGTGKTPGAARGRQRIGKSGSRVAWARASLRAGGPQCSCWSIRAILGARRLVLASAGGGRAAPRRRRRCATPETPATNARGARPAALGGPTAARLKPAHRTLAPHAAGPAAFGAP